MCGCSFNDDYNEDVLMDILYNDKDTRLFSYSAVPESDKQMVWHEEFDNNDSKFPVDTSIVYSNITTFIKDGILTISSEINDRIPIRFPLEIDGRRNFEVEINLFVSNGILEQKCLLMCGNTDVNSMFQGYLVGIDEDLKIRIIWVFIPIITFDIKDYLMLGDFNIVTIRKIDDTFIFFINKKFVYSEEKKNLYCNSAYFYLYSGINMFDYMRVQYIND